MIRLRAIGYAYLSAALAIMFMDSYSRSMAASVPVGTTIYNECEIAPEGFLARDGSEVSRTEYARLFALIGTRYGEGDGETTFSVGDFRDCFIRGAGGTLGAPVGTKQLDGAPNAWWKSRYGGNIGTSNMFDSGNTSGTGIDMNFNTALGQFGLSLSKASASYGRDDTTEVRPTNYAQYPYVKF